MNKINDFVDEFAKYIDIDNPEFKQKMFSFLNERGISIKGNYFNIKVNKDLKPRGRPRKEFVFNEIINSEEKKLNVNENKEYKLIREISKGSYKDMLGQNYTSKELIEESYI